MHVGLLEQAVALAEVARAARGDDVLPDGFAAARARDDVVERQSLPTVAAVDAAPAVTGEQRSPRDASLHGLGGRGMYVIRRITCGRT